ncbi:Oligoendopeptidase F, plasmid [Paenibacillus sp. P1XP2]|nr:Oligoendopeptidase F, plasmid [Paenibacillus sp. P1XP2]
MEKLLKRSEVAEEHKWNVEDLFDGQKAWDQTYAELQQELKKIAEFQGKLDNANAVKDCFALEDDISLKTERLYVYAHLHHDEDTANPTYQALSQKAKKLNVQVGEAFLSLRRKFCPCRTKSWTRLSPIPYSRLTNSP